MKQRIRRLACPVIGILIGVGFILVGVSLYGIVQDATFYSAGYGSDTVHLGSKEYGADYYSDSYEAMAFGANAVKNVFDLLSVAIPAFFILVGCLIVCAFAHVILGSCPSRPSDKDAVEERVFDVAPSADSNEGENFANSDNEERAVKIG